MTETITGPYGVGRVVPIADPTNPKAALTVVQWLLRVPDAHPAWDQYMLVVVSLADHPAFPPANVNVPGATHELLVLALDPEEGPYDVAKIQSYEQDGKLPHLQPPSVSAQVTATEAELVEVARLSALAICQGQISPEPPMSTMPHWDTWKQMLDNTLDHLRGGH